MTSLGKIACLASMKHQSSVVSTFISIKQVTENNVTMTFTP